MVAMLCQSGNISGVWKTVTSLETSLLWKRANQFHDFCREKTVRYITRRLGGGEKGQGHHISHGVLSRPRTDEEIGQNRGLLHTVLAKELVDDALER